MSISTVPYTRPRRSAKSSTPSTTTTPSCGSGSRRIIRNSELRPVSNPSPDAEPGAGPAGQRQPDRGEHPPEPRAATGIPRGQTRDLLGEGPLRTDRMVTEEPSYSQLDHHRHAADRRIGDPAPVAAVDPRRRRCAPWTTRLRPDDARGDDHSIRYPFDPLDHRAYQLRKQRPYRLKIAPQTRSPRRRHSIGRHAGASPITKCGPDPGIWPTFRDRLDPCPRLGGGSAGEEDALAE